MLSYICFRYHYQYRTIADCYIYDYHNFLFFKYFIHYVLILLNSFVALLNLTKLTLNRISLPYIRINYNPALNSLKLLKIKYFLLFLSFLTVLTNINNVNALSSVSVGKVRGSLPYITFDGGQTKETKLTSLLTIRLADGRVYVPENGITMIYPNAIVDTSSPRVPIEVPVENNHFSDVFTFVPLSSGNSNISSIDLNTLFGSHYFWQDDDGDGYFSSSGQVTLKWQDSSGADVSSIAKEHPDWGFDPCQSPYRLTISVTNSDISTQYGIPRIGGSVLGSSHTYYLRPKITTPYVCYARPPNISNDSTSGSGLPDLNGSAWVAGLGFKPQDIYYPPKNFPTTGANNLSFDLVIAGLTAQQVLEGYSNGIINGVNFEDNNPPKDGHERFNITNKTGTTKVGYTYVRLNVKLSIAPNQDINTGNKLRVTILPLRLNEVITDGSAFYIDYKATNTRLYSFKIKRWFWIAEPGRTCQSYEYFPGLMPTKFGLYEEPPISDLTNANGFTWNGGISGRNINNYRREISTYRSYLIQGNKDDWRTKYYWLMDTINGGLFSEWGNITKEQHPDSGLTQGNYITRSEYYKEPKKDNWGQFIRDIYGNIVYEYKYYSVASYDGRILQGPGSETNRLCVFFGSAF